MKKHQQHMTKAERLINDQQTQHGERLRAIFPKAADYTGYALYVRVRALEVEAHKLAEDQCNRPLSESYVERKEESILSRLDDILGFRERKIPIFCNGDPRGYGLKIREADAKNLDIHKDWGGYGIIAPDFT